MPCRREPTHVRADLRQNGRHGCADQHHERRLLYAPVLGRTTVASLKGLQRRLHAAGKLFRLFDLVRQSDLLDQLAQLEHALLGTGVLARGYVERVLGVGQVQIISLDAPYGRVGRGVGVDRQKQIGLLFIGQFGTAFERHEGIVGASVDHLAAQAFFN